MDSRYSDGAALTPNEITGILTASMFAGHHTSSGTAAWTLIELLRNPDVAGTRGGRRSIACTRATPVPTYQSLREVPVLEARPQGGAATASAARDPDARCPPGSPRRRHHRAGRRAGGDLAAGLAPPSRSCFADPERFDPERYAPGREEDATPFAWIPFGGGHHRCSGSAFAFMQLKAITASLLRRWTFELRRSARELRPRLHQDGRAAAATVPGALSSSRRAEERGCDERAARRGQHDVQSGNVQGQSRPRPLSGPCRVHVRGAGGVSRRRARQHRHDVRTTRRRSAARQGRARRQALPHPRAVDRGSEEPPGGHDACVPTPGDGRDDAPLDRRQRARRGRG